AAIRRRVPREPLTCPCAVRTLLRPHVADPQRARLFDADLAQISEPDLLPPRFSVGRQRARPAMARPPSRRLPQSHLSLRARPPRRLPNQLSLASRGARR